jgi:hypothetical protein
MLTIESVAARSVFVLVATPRQRSSLMITSDQLDRISSILATAPAWARLALTSADTRLRARGADELSAFLVRRIGEPQPCHDENQLTLPIAG